MTPRDELYALLAEYEKEGACSCPETALLRWAFKRLDEDYPGDAGLAHEAIRRMRVIDHAGRQAS